MGITDQIIGVESGGDANAQNPNSSALGSGQFLASTWLDTLAKHRPDITGTPDELLALRTDPQLSKEMTAAYAADNGQTLSKAGFEASPANTYLAHFAGPQGAVKVLSADPNAPVASILGDAAVKANPFLQGMTAADLQAWASRKMGGVSQQPATQTAQASPASPANTPMTAQTGAWLAQILGQGRAAPQAQQVQAGAPGASSLATLNNLLAQISQQQTQTIFPKQALHQPRLASLQAALQASGNRGPLFSKG